MAKRRPLTTGLKKPEPPVDPKREDAFVYGGKNAAPAEPAAAPSPAGTPAAGKVRDRVPISTRMRTDLADALKDVSLDRQKQRADRSTFQDILEEAVEPWLRSNGYLK